jgi:sulfite reductase (NADPH) flavoprotein alpha-component
LGDPNYESSASTARNWISACRTGRHALLDGSIAIPNFRQRRGQWLKAELQKMKPGAVDTRRSRLPLARPRLEPVQGQSACLSACSVNLHLNQQGANKETRMFSLDAGDSGLNYEAGDALGVWPRNCPELVDEMLELTGLNADTPVLVDKLVNVPLHQALTEHFEIARPNSETLAFIAERSEQPELKQLLGSERRLS